MLEILWLWHQYLKYKKKIWVPEESLIKLMMECTYIHVNKTKHAFVYAIHFKPVYQPKCCGYLIDNRADAPIRVLDDNGR